MGDLGECIARRLTDVAGGLKHKSSAIWKSFHARRDARDDASSIASAFVLASTAVDTPASALLRDSIEESAKAANELRAVVAYHGLAVGTELEAADRFASSIGACAGRLSAIADVGEWAYSPLMIAARLDEIAVEIERICDTTTLVRE